MPSAYTLGDISITIRTFRAGFKHNIRAFGQEQRAILCRLNFNTIVVVIPLDDFGAVAFVHIGEMDVLETVITYAHDIHIATRTEECAEGG